MLKRQVWMADDDEFEHIVRNSQRILKLNAQYENHPYVEEFTKKCNVMFVYGTYVLEGEVDAKFSSGDKRNLFQKDPLRNNASRQKINCMKTWNYLQKTLDLPLNTEIITQAHGLMLVDDDLLKVKPDCLLVHVGTNDLTHNANLLKKMVNKVKNLSPNTKLVFSSVILRKDKKDISKKVGEANQRLQNYCKQKNMDFVDNSNIIEEHLGSKKLHLNKRGNF